MSRWIITGLFTLLATAGVAATVEASADAVAEASIRAWSIAAFLSLRTAVLFALSFCVFVRKPPKRHSRDPIAFVACAAALSSVVLLEKPSDDAATALVVAGDFVALAASVWLLVSFVTLGRCFGLLPEARGLVTHGPYRLVRHPVYLGEFGAVAGLLLASPTARNAIVASGFAAAQAVRMRLEERALTNEFPEYAAYSHGTPRLVPRLRPHLRSGRSAAALGLFVALIVWAAPIGASAAKPALRTPALLSPAAGARTDGVPWFGWAPVAGAAQYEFQIAADAGMNAPVLGPGQDRFFTKNTRATLRKSLPDRTYWWRVRATSAGGEVSPWSAPRAFTKTLAPPRPLSPVGGVAVSYPGTPLKLMWSAVDRATKYLVTLASDPNLGSVVGGKPVETYATTFTRPGPLPPGTYYWGVSPVDAQGNTGTPSAVASFTWVWPSATAVRIDDLVAAPEVFDPQFSWNPIPGAARYEIEVNPSQDFAPGSKVCCAGTTIGTRYSPTVVFKDNRYYWRVRGYDVDGNAGVWNEGPVFEKRFDKVPPVVDTSIKNLRIRDNYSDPGSDQDGTTPETYETYVPLLTWDPVPGASSYQVEVAPAAPTAADCNWTAAGNRWVVNTSVNAWTPLGSGWNGQKPYFDPMSVATDLPSLNAGGAHGGAYCARVRARSDRDSTGGDIYGDYTYVVNGRGRATPGPVPAFRWLGYPAGEACSACTPNYLGAADYFVPASGSFTPRTPYFTWRPIAGKKSYFVLVSKDAQFSNIVDYGFTQIPAYSPRSLFRPTTYPDETTSYYWAVLPANQPNGAEALAGNPLQAAPQAFEKRSTPPARIEPAPGADLTGHPTFRWTSVEGARRYRFQVAQDDRFGSLLEDVVTDSTAYTSNTTYPADTVLYWRVRADDENLIGLTWSDAGTFQKRLPAPVVTPGLPTRGDFIPTWTWDPVPGAVSYDVHAELPDGTERDLTGNRTAALTPVLMYGTGVFRWKVRAHFPKLPFGTIAGPYSGTHVFTRTIAEPTGVRSDDSKRYPLLLWDAKPGPKSYQVQVSARPDFAVLVENVSTDNTNHAPLLLQPAYTSGGALYWRVAAVDEGRNVGDWSPTQRIGVVKQLRLRARGAPKRKRVRKIRITVLGEGNRPVTGAAVRVSGAGSRAAQARTNRRGIATFRVRATRRGSLSFRATKSGYAAAVLRLRVR
jgi:protein-S-isoprenylcysteine O-methyltransferase Ste14